MSQNKGSEWKGREEKGINKGRSIWKRKLKKEMDKRKRRMKEDNDVEGNGRKGNKEGRTNKEEKNKG